MLSFNFYPKQLADDKPSQITKICQERFDGFAFSYNFLLYRERSKQINLAVLTLFIYFFLQKICFLKIDLTFKQILIFVKEK